MDTDASHLFDDAGADLEQADAQLSGVGTRVPALLDFFAMSSFGLTSFGFGRVLGAARAVVLAFAFLGASLVQPVPAFSDTRAGLATAEREPLAVPAKPVWSAPAATAERAAPPAFDPPAGDGISPIPVVDLRVPAVLAVAAPVPGENRLTASTALPPESTGPPSA